MRRGANICTTIDYGTPNITTTIINYYFAMPSFIVNDRVVNQPIKLVLIGGGYFYAIALKLWSKNSLPRVNLTLISDV